MPDVDTQPDLLPDRRIALRMRPDLKFCAQWVRGRRYWAVKDPISLEYYHLRDEEHAILTRLNGRIGLSELRRQFEQQFAPRSLPPEQLQAFLGTLHKYGLLAADSAGQGEQLLLRRDDRRRRRRLQALTNILAIRFRGIDPEPLLAWLLPRCRFLFSPAWISFFLLLMLAAASLVVVQFGTFRAKLPEWGDLVGAANLPLLALTLLVVKVLHELGHGLACKRYGAECHELGLMLLVFTPCLYCNVSDSWMLSNKWHRMAVAAAGIYVELILAAIATFLWWLSQPGSFNAMCFNVMLVCSVGTVLFNGNPLLRYDGYFIFSDLIEVPNLSERATRMVRAMFGRCCLGLRAVTEEGDSLPMRAGLVLYWGASTVYRWLLVVAVLWTLSAVLQMYRLNVVATAIACVAIAGMVGPPLSAAGRTVRDPLFRYRVARGRMVISAMVIGSVAAAVFLVPLPRRVTAPAVVEYLDAQRVYVSAPGRLQRVATTGQVVERGEPLARLHNDEMAMELARLQGERDRQKLHLAHLEARQLIDGAAGNLLPAARAALDDLQQRVDQLQQDQARLTIVAPRSGTVLPPPDRPRDVKSPERGDVLAAWTGIPLDERNEGSYLETGTLLCLIGDPDRYEAVLMIDQAGIELVQSGQRVQLMFEHLPGVVLEGTIGEIAELDLRVVPRGLTASDDVAARGNRAGSRHLQDARYQARVGLDEHGERLLAGITGEAKIVVAPCPLGERVWRSLQQTFRF